MTENTPVFPRPSATVLLLRDDPFEVLMVRRNNAGIFAHAMVFPGGLLEEHDRSDDWHPLIANADGMDVDTRAHRIAACRETWEEAAMLMVTGGNGDCPMPPQRPTAQDFHDAVRMTGGVLDLASMHHFAHWITPEDSPKRYNTHFFLARAPEGLEARCDGQEAVELEWIRPEEALNRARTGVGAVMFPTRLNLMRLAESSTVDEAIAATREREVVTVLPTVEPLAGGGSVVRIPADSGYAETEERMSFDRHP